MAAMAVFFYFILLIDFLMKSSNIPTVELVFLFQPMYLYCRFPGRKTTNTNLAQQKTFSTLSTYLLLQIIPLGRQKTNIDLMTFMNFEYGHHGQDGCHEVTSCGDIRIQLLLLGCIPVRTVAVIYILNKFCKVCNRHCIHVLLLFFSKLNKFLPL